MITQSLIKEMEAYFGSDQRRIKHAHRVLEFSQKIMAVELGDREIVEAAAVLHDIGIKNAELKYNSNSGKYQEMEGPAVAEPILEKVGFPKDKMPLVLAIIGNHHTAGGVKADEFKVIWDADWLVNLADEYDIEDKAKISGIINRIFVTQTGKGLARKLYLNEGKQE
jgi:CRISPR/Cas system-associated endonuclease Cas3-HD